MLAPLFLMMTGGTAMIATGRRTWGVGLIAESVTLLLVIRHLAMQDGPPTVLPDV